MAHEHAPDCARFVLTQSADGVIDLAVCWDSAGVREIAETLRQVAAALEVMPPGTTARAVAPL